MPNTYECPICYAINAAQKTHCSSCGTVPASYSVTRRPARYLSEEMGDIINGFISVVAAVGVDRAERYRTVKRTLRTVPADYYAVED